MNLYPLAFAVILLGAVTHGLAEPNNADELRQLLPKLLVVATTRPDTTADFTVLVVRQSPRQILVFQRHGSDNLELMCDGAGRPIGFAKNRQVFYASPQYPGQLLTFENAAWSLVVHNDEATFAVKNPLADPGVTLWWDPGSVTSLFLDHGAVVEHDHNSAAYSLSAKDYIFDLAIALDNGKKTYISFFDVYHADSNFTVFRLSNAIPLDLDLKTVTPRAIQDLNLPSRKLDGSALPDLSVNDSESITKDELNISDALSHVLPVRGCVAEWLLANGTERLSIASSIALDIAAQDEELSKNVLLASNKQGELLKTVCADVLSGKLDIPSACDRLRAESPFSVDLSSILSHDQYIEFSWRYAASPEPCDFTLREHAMRRAILDVSKSLGLNREVRYLLSMECMREDAKLDVIGSECFSMHISKDVAVDQLKSVDRETSQAVKNVGLTSDQLNAIFVKSKEVSDRYKRDFMPLYAH
jgi:hypothetical protein